MKVKVYVVDFAIPSRVKRWGLPIGIPVLVLSVAVVALAAPVNFSDGQTLTAEELNTSFGYLVPSGAVMFFDLSACPAGWAPVSEAEGRYLVGLPASGTLGGTVGTALTDEENRPVGQHSHTVTDPGHSHGVTDPGHGHGVNDSGHQHGSGYAGFIDYTCADAPNVDFGGGFAAGGQFSVLGTCPGGTSGLGAYGLTANATTGIAIQNNTTNLSINSATTGITIANAGSVTGTNAPYVQFLVCQKN